MGMKTDENRFNEINALLEYQNRCLLLDIKPLIDGMFEFKIVRKKRKYDVILMNIHYNNESSNLVIPSIFNKIRPGLYICDRYDEIDFSNIESLPSYLCVRNKVLKRVKGNKVYNIGSFCFYKCSNLYEIDFPLLSSVHKCSFSMTNIKEFKAFYLTYIEKDCFLYTHLDLVNINKYIETYNKGASLRYGAKEVKIESISINYRWLKSMEHCGINMILSLFNINMGLRHFKNEKLLQFSLLEAEYLLKINIYKLSNIALFYYSYYDKPAQMQNIKINQSRTRRAYLLKAGLNNLNIEEYFDLEKQYFYGDNYKI